MDDVLSLFQSDEEESEFSGFEQLEAMPVSMELTRTHKADVAKGPDIVGPRKKVNQKKKPQQKRQLLFCQVLVHVRPRRI